MSTRISAVVRCLNEASHIERLVHGMRAQDRPVDEIVFVDSGSTDGTLEIIDRLGDVVVHIDKSEFSFGRSLNLGIAAASGDLVLICSAHVYPSHDSWVSQLSIPFEDPSVSYVYGRQVGDCRTKFSEERVMKSWFPPTSSARQPFPFANNANSMIRKADWSLRPFDESLTGLEDIEWAKSVQESGRVVAYRADAPVYHVHEESWLKIRNRYRREAIAYKRIFPESEMSVLRAGVLGMSSAALDLMAALRNRRRVSVRDVLLFRANQFYGTWRGFSGGLPDSQLLARLYYPRRTGSMADSVVGKELAYHEFDGLARS